MKQAYIPDLFGKEKRKRKPGKEGKLGVEGMSPAVLEHALRQAGATILGEETGRAAPALTKADLYACGLSGGENSREKRKKLLAALGLPEHLSPNAMLAGALCPVQPGGFVERTGKNGNKRLLTCRK